MTDAETLEIIGEVRAGCREHDGQDPVDEATDLLLRHHPDRVAAYTLDRVGFALRHGTAVDLAVRPDARGRGLGRDLAALAVPESGPLTAWSHGDHPAAARLAARHGLERARELWVMRRAAPEPLPDAPAPAGVRFRSFRPDDEPQLLVVNAAAFADHPEQGDLDADAFAARTAEPWWEPEGLIVAVDEQDSMLGFHWTKRHEEDRGEVYVMAVAPEAQGRGLGRALTVAGLHHLADRHITEIHLYVESDNRRAVDLYSGLGFRHHAGDTHVQYRRRG